MLRDGQTRIPVTEDGRHQPRGQLEGLGPVGALAPSSVTPFHFPSTSRVYCSYLAAEKEVRSSDRDAAPAKLPPAGSTSPQNPAILPDPVAPLS